MEKEGGFLFASFQYYALFPYSSDIMKTPGAALCIFGMQSCFINIIQAG
jgi:hypothetical protein